MKKIIYIIGLGRSGSTILDIILGNGENILSCGEVNRYAPRQGKPSYWCQFKDSSTWLFWEKINTKLAERLLGRSIDFETLTKLTLRYEYHTSFFKIKGKDYETYSHFVLALYETLFEHIEQSTIVDSSKYPARALRIAEMTPYQLGFIYLQRDPRGVVTSFAKRDVREPDKGWLSANLYYLLGSLLCQYTVYKLKKSQQNVIVITYESLIEKPVETLIQIQNKLEINLNPAIEKIKQNKQLYVGPLFDGNRVKTRSEVKLETKIHPFPNNVKNFFTKLINLVVYK